jgi:hypothetical protein
MPTGKASPKKKISPAAAKSARKALPAKTPLKPALKPPAKAGAKSSSKPAKKAIEKSPLKSTAKRPPAKVVTPSKKKIAASVPKKAAVELTAPAAVVEVRAPKKKVVAAEPAVVADVVATKRKAVPQTPANDARVLAPKSKGIAVTTVIAEIAEIAAPKKNAVTDRPDTSAEDSIRDKKYTELFGISQPKGRGVNLQGEPVKPDDAAAQGWSIMQYPPRTGRLTWIYATHGLSTSHPKGKDKPTRIELAMHWRERGTQPISVLTAIANYILQSGHLLAPGDVVSEAEGVHVGVTDLMLKHFIALSPEPFMPRALDVPGGDVRPVMLLGISDAELESATKVRPELADGKLVLMDALRSGGVFPVTDPRRQCLTRRRDFLRIWETSFRGIRERKK